MAGFLKSHMHGRWDTVSLYPLAYNVGLLFCVSVVLCCLEVHQVGLDITKVRITVSALTTWLANHLKSIMALHKLSIHIQSHP